MADRFHRLLPDDGTGGRNLSSEAEYVGLAPCDTVVTLPSQHNDTLRMVLPLWYDYILKYDCSPELSKENILKGHPKLRLVIPEEQEQKIRTHFFWIKYGVSYDVFIH